MTAVPSIIAQGNIADDFNSSRRLGITTMGKQTDAIPAQISARCQ